MSTPRVSVVVPAARNAARLGACLDAIARAEPKLALEVVVVLNAAEPGLDDVARSAAGDIRVVSSDVPLGFAGGVNLGARAARGDALHMLHDDAVVEAGAISALVAALDDAEIGAAGSLLLDPDGRTPQGAGYVLWRDGRTEPPWRGAPPNASGFAGTRAVDYCSSASVLVRADAWRAIGGLDEELHPAQFVDVDLAMRLRAAGYVVVCAPASRVRHARGGTAGGATRRVAWERNRARFLETWAEDLGWQEPFAEDDDALARAHAATLRRATVVRSMRPRPVPELPAAETEPERADRERRALLRDVAFKSACVRELERVDARAAELGAEVRALRQELDHVHAAHAVEVSHRRDYAAQRDELAARVTTQDDVIAYLTQRAQVLDGILTGRWWRLRERLAAVQRLGRRGR